jgi:6-phosphogluconolactonase
VAPALAAAERRGGGAAPLALEVAASAAAAAERAAARIAAAARRGAHRRGRFALALSGGASAAPLLRALARADVPWSAVHIFQVDERVSQRGSPARNWTELERNLGPLPLREAQLHPMPVETPDLDAAALAYARELGAAAGHPPALDLVHLGLGVDGHTASLVPGDGALELRERAVIASAASYQGYRRLTLGFAALAWARQRLWLVTGAAKRPALAGLLAEDLRLPASRVNRIRSAVIADAEAACVAEECAAERPDV